MTNDGKPLSRSQGVLKPKPKPSERSLARRERETDNPIC